MCATVGTVGGRERNCSARSIVLIAGLLVVCRCVSGLNPSLDVSQYAHTAWTVREGFAKSEISSIAQTPDGYLWLGTESGLLRFDGVRNLSWQPPGNQHLPSSVIISLLATRDGTLWIGTLKGLASWKDGKLTQYAELAEHWISKILQDREGTVWAGGASISRGGGELCAFRNGNVQCYGEDGTLGRGALNLYEDTKGNLWAGVATGLWRWRPGPPRFFPLAGEPDGIQALSEDTDGALLVGWNGGIHRFHDGKTEAYSLPSTVRQSPMHRMLRDRDGGLWIATPNHGIIHMHQGRTDFLAQADGLSGDAVISLFEDREGTIWASTINGLDRFRDFAVATLNTKQGLSHNLVVSALADRDGSVWLGTRGGLNRWNDGQIKTYSLGSDTHTRKLHAVPTSLFQDDRGRVWVGTLRDFGYLENSKFVPIRGLPGGDVLAIVQGRRGYMWVAKETLGLFRLSPRGEVLQIPWTVWGHKDHASVMTPDPHSGIWTGFALGGIAYFTADAQIRASYTTADGLGAGRVSGFQFDHDGALWISTEEGGLSRVKNGHVATLTSKNGLPCDAVNWVMEDDDHGFWLYMACGLVRIARSELDAWAASVDQNKDMKRTIQATVLDSFDGVRSLAGGGHYSPQVAKTPDGRIWFLPWDGVSVVDPAHLAFNKVLPPVHIEQVIADHKTYAATPGADGKVRLPPLIRDLQIDYTALSLVAPEKVLFRYKLEGWDKDWQEGGTRRQAFYSNLPPHNYTFRVKACNNSGVWNEAGTSLDFSIAPAYYQTAWFRLSCVAALLAALWGLYQFRLRQLANEFNMRLDERVSERTRIARELHDTLLQNVQGLILKIHAIGKRIPVADPIRQEIEKTLDYADQVLAEGRDRVRDLRAPKIGFGELPNAFQQVVEEAAPNRLSTFKTVVEGTVLELHPIIREETYSIGREALINALTHSEAHNIEAEITYDSREFRLRIRDDGRGIDPGVLEKGARDDHWGLQGMRERAKRIGAKLDLWSRPGSGTEVELTVPAATAYRSPRSKPTDSKPSVAAAR